MVNIKVLFAQIAYLIVFFTLPLFLAAGTIAWLAGWVFLLLFFSFTFALTLWLFKHNPGLLQERMTIAPGPIKKPGIKCFLLPCMSYSWPGWS